MRGLTAEPARTGMKCPCYETAPDEIGLIGLGHDEPTVQG